MSVDEADFVYLRQETESTAGNLSVQPDKPVEAGYINTQRILKAKTRTLRCMTEERQKGFRGLWRI